MDCSVYRHLWIRTLVNEIKHVTVIPLPGRWATQLVRAEISCFLRLGPAGRAWLSACFSLLLSGGAAGRRLSAGLWLSACSPDDSLFQLRAHQVDLHLRHYCRVERAVDAARVVLADPRIVARRGLGGVRVNGADRLAIRGIAPFEQCLVSSDRIGVVDVYRRSLARELLIEITELPGNRVQRLLLGGHIRRQRRDRLLQTQASRDLGHFGRQWHLGPRCSGRKHSEQPQTQCHPARPPDHVRHRRSRRATSASWSESRNRPAPGPPRPPRSRTHWQCSIT